VIPFARGRIRSRKIDQVVSEVENLVKLGYREFVLTGIHLSSYGMERYGVPGEYGLQDLIEQVASVDGVERVRLGSVEPQIFTQDFIDRVKKVKEFCPHFHLSLQSGCDATLKRMNRKYTAQEYFETCQIIREAFDHPAITTDVIVGFPGETEEEFLESKAFIEKVKFYELHVFKFSRREGTKADTMKDQIPEAVKTERSRILIEIGKRMSEEFRQEVIGREQEILIEDQVEVDGETYWQGYTKEYIKMGYSSDRELTNKIVTGKATGFLSRDMVLLDRDSLERVR
jgi:threonylcarbamoyladenosine tRNA methylthiotransferase MtaB